jgi:hypothetical protein
MVTDEIFQKQQAITAPPHTKKGVKNKVMFWDEKMKPLFDTKPIERVAQ